MTAPTPLQQQILDVLGSDELHGHAIAERIRDTTVSMQLVSFGALYRALSDLEEAGAITSRRETPVTDHRPACWLYRKAAP